MLRWAEGRETLPLGVTAPRRAAQEGAHPGAWAKRGWDPVGLSRYRQPRSWRLLWLLAQSCPLSGQQGGAEGVQTGLYKTGGVYENI